MKDLKYFNVLFRYIKNDKFKLIIYILFTAIMCFTSVLYPLLYSKILYSLTTKNFNGFLFYLATWDLLAVIVNNIMTFIRIKYFDYLEIKFMTLVSKDLYNKIINLPESIHEEKSVGEFSNRICSDPDKIMDKLTSIIKVACRLINVAIIFFISLSINYILALELLVFIVVMYVACNVFYPKIEKNQEIIKTHSDEYMKKTHQMLEGNREIKALGIKKRTFLMIGDTIDKLMHEESKQRRVELWYKMANLFAYLVLEFTILFTVGILYFKGKIGFEIFTLMEMYLWRVDDAIEGINELGPSYKKMIVSLKRIDDILHERTYKVESYGKKNIVSKGIIDFKDVEFKYNENNYLTLNKLNIKFEPGKKIAIVGKSGQGKTTLFNLLLRYFDSTKGSITLDNINIKDLTEESLRNNISIIRQNPYMFNMTIKDNFKILDKNVTLKEIRRVCKRAYIDDYIMSLPNKYNTLIGEGGVNLSGGQKQRLAIARTLLKNTKVILFDEATSALDNESQEYIKRTIDDLVSNHTVIIVAHRLSTIMDADIIYIIDDGHVTDYGTHETLLKTSELYKNLYSPEITIV